MPEHPTSRPERDTVVETPVSLDLPLAEQWTRHGIDPTRLTIKSDGTLLDPTASPGQEAPTADLEQLPQLIGDAAPHLDMGEVVGAGGMGIVRTAVQAGLDREVAVKQVRRGPADERHGAALLREARVTGAIAHPNVVPVHLVGVDDGGLPVMVMKRVEGRGWDEELAEDRPQAPDGRWDDARLERHLRILVQVAHAVHYAHSKGVLHRDLKPANVLVGRFGEVYLVDWGLAVSVFDEGLDGVPHARDVTRVMGTPAYMAPEMAAALGDLIGVRTDVYQLGCILFELLTGEPPHRGSTPEATLIAAYENAPVAWDPFAPDGLTSICERAMARDPEDRFPDAEGFRVALEGWMRTASITRLRQEAEQRLESLEELLARVEEGERDLDRAIQQAFAECRFGFDQVRRSPSPEDHAATEGLQHAIELMIDYELRASRPGAAEALVAALPLPRPALEKRVKAASETNQAERQRLRELEHHRDVGVGATLRSRISGGIGAFWVVANLACGQFHRSEHGPVEPLFYGGLLAAILLFIGIAQQRWHRTLYEHELNRTVSFAVMVMLAHDVAAWGLVYVLDLTMQTGMIWMDLIAVSMWGLLAVTADRAIVVPAIVFASILPLLLLWPQWLFEWTALASMFGHGGLAFVWKQRARAQAAAAAAAEAQNR